MIGPLIFSIVSANVSDGQFAAWGWRISLLLSALLITVGLLFIRLKMSESPVFQRAVEEREQRQEEAQLPVIEAIKTYPKTI